MAFDDRLIDQISGFNPTTEDALTALEQMDDCARSECSINPIGPYAILKKFIEEHHAIFRQDTRGINDQQAANSAIVS